MSYSRCLITILGYVLIDHRRYCAATCASTKKPDPFYHLLHLVGVTKCCHIDLKTVYKTGENNTMQREPFSPFNLHLLISF